METSDALQTGTKLTNLALVPAVSWILLSTTLTIGFIGLAKNYCRAKFEDEKL